MVPSSTAARAQLTTPRHNTSAFEPEPRADPSANSRQNWSTSVPGACEKKAHLDATTRGNSYPGPPLSSMLKGGEGSLFTEMALFFATPRSPPGPAPTLSFGGAGGRPRSLTLRDGPFFRTHRTRIWTSWGAYRVATHKIAARPRRCLAGRTDVAVPRCRCIQDASPRSDGASATSKRPAEAPKKTVGALLGGLHSGPRSCHAQGARLRTQRARHWARVSNTSRAGEFL